jgi:hypothetical protein
MKLKHILFLVALVLLVTPVIATSASFSQTFTFTMPYGLRVDPGFENVMPVAWAFLLYNGMSLFFTFFVAGYISLRNVRFGIFALDGFAAIFWWFGWMSFYNPSTDTANWWSPLNLIVLAGVMGGAIYLKEANRERYGTGGTGLTLLNVLYYFILLQTVIGFTNITGIWQINSAATPTAYQYDNVDLQGQVTSASNTGGLLGGIISTATGLANLAPQALQAFLLVIQGICGYDSILLSAFPWLSMSTSGMAFVWIFRVVILLLDGWFIFMVLFRPPVIDQVGV